MEVGVFVNSIDNLDFVKGTYSMDFYLHFRWTDPAIPTAHFEIMNGQPSNEPHSLEKLSESKDGLVKEEWYRVRADFSITPNIRDYPFESGITPIEIEDADNDETQLIYVPIVNDSGIDPGSASPAGRSAPPRSRRFITRTRGAGPTRNYRSVFRSPRTRPIRLSRQSSPR